MSAPKSIAELFKLFQSMKANFESRLKSLEDTIHNNNVEISELKDKITTSNKNL